METGRTIQHQPSTLEALPPLGARACSGKRRCATTSSVAPPSAERVRPRIAGEQVAVLVLVLPGFLGASLGSPGRAAWGWQCRTPSRACAAAMPTAGEGVRIWSSGTSFRIVISASLRHASRRQPGMLIGTLLEVSGSWRTQGTPGLSN